MNIPESLKIEPFSKYKESLKMLYLTDEDFKNLVDDYSISKMNLEKYQGKLQEDVQRKLEYENLALELEKEILRRLMKTK